ncbi:hypothetical protein GCM10027521_55230 [Amycolatopsis cihanbeyliensis]
MHVGVHQPGKQDRVAAELDDAATGEVRVERFHGHDPTTRHTNRAGDLTFRGHRSTRVEDQIKFRHTIYSIM